MTIPMQYLPKAGRPCPPPRRGTPPPRVPEALQWPLPLLLDKFEEYRATLIKQVKDSAYEGLELDIEATVAAAVGRTTYTKEEVNQLVAGSGGKFLVVQVLPNAADADPKAIYLVPRSPGETNNIFDEYLRVEPTTSTYAWEKVGSTDIDLSNYVQTTDSRLSNARTPTAHKSSHATGGADALSPADIGAAQASHTHAQSNVTGLAAALAAKRGLDDLYVRGDPGSSTGASWFSVNGVLLNKVSASVWSGGDYSIEDYGGGAYSFVKGQAEVLWLIEALGSDFTYSFTDPNTGLSFVIAGYVDALAKTSQLPAASTATPQMDGTASAGSSAAFARGDHVHPTDTSRASTDDVALAPVYSQTPTFSEWTFSDELNHTVLGPFHDDVSDYWYYTLDSDDGINSSIFSTEAEALLATHLTFYALEDIDATRTSTSIIIGYTLGSQTNKVLASTNAISSAISATNPNFSNAVLQVGIGVDTNTVAAINALVEAGDELPIGGATTVGALLLALAAAVAALRKSKADASALRYDIGTEIAISSASSEVIEGETVTYGDTTLADRTANIVAITAAIAELRLAFPAVVSGKVRDFGLRVEVGTGSAALTAPALVPPAGVTLENADGAIPALADGAADAKGVTLLYFSETSPGVFLVKGEHVKEA